MALVSLGTVGLIAAAQPSPTGDRTLPRWSWDTIQTFMHCANVTGEWNEAALAAMSRMSYVTFESGHKMYEEPIMDQEEAKIAESCRLVKLRSGNQTTCLMYTEADWARRTYSLGHALDAQPSEELHCGGVLQSRLHYQQSIDPLTGKWWNYTAHAYDYGNAAGAEKWIERVTTTVATGWVDGTFLDGLPYPLWTPPTTNCSKAEVARYAAGMNQTVRELARRLGPEGIIIANGVVTPEYKAIATGWMEDQAYGREPNYTYSCGLFDKPCVVAYHTPWTGSLQSFAQGLTSFLLSLQPYQYFATGSGWSGGGGGAADHNPWAPDLGPQACQTWLKRYPEYDRKLGHPLGPAWATNDTWPRLYPAANGSVWDRCATDPREAALGQQQLHCMVWRRDFEFARVFQGQYVDPNCTVDTRFPGGKDFKCVPPGNCIYWSDGNITGDAVLCPPHTGPSPVPPPVPPPPPPPPPPPSPVSAKFDCVVASGKNQCLPVAQGFPGVDKATCIARCN